jgi:hypothetical protein
MAVDVISPSATTPKAANENAAQVLGAPCGVLPATQAFQFRIIGDKPFELPKWLVKNLLPETGVALLAGQYASGKTFVAIDIALSVCLGHEFFSRKTRSGAVLWIAAEGGGEIEARVRAARLGKFESDDDDEVPFIWIESTPDLSGQGGVAWLNCAIAAASDMSKNKFDAPLRLVVVDTLAATFNIEDENDNAEAARIMKRLSDVGKERGVLIMPVAHLGKTAESGVRGASAYGAGADAILGLLANADGLTGAVSSRSMSLVKTRRGSTGPLSAFKLTPFEIGRDEDGESVTSCFVTFDSTAPVGGPGRLSLSRGAMIFNDAFNEAADTNGREHRVRGDGLPVKAVPVNAVRVEFMKRYLTGESDAKKKDVAARQAWRRALKEVTGLTLFAGENLAFGGGEELIWRVRELACDM